MSKLLSKLEALSPDEQTGALIAPLLTLERDRAADPIWQRRRSFHAAEKARRRWHVVVVFIALGCLLLAFAVGDPFGAARAVATFTEDHLEAIAVITLCSVALAVSGVIEYAELVNAWKHTVFTATLGVALLTLVAVTVTLLQLTVAVAP